MTGRTTPSRSRIQLGLVESAIVVLLVAGSFAAGAILGPDVQDFPQISRDSGTYLPEALGYPTPTPYPSAMRENADAEEVLVATIYENTAPSVVHIRVIQQANQVKTPSIEIPGFPKITPPENGFRQGQASGFVWDEAGHIVTNYHVVQDAAAVEVIFFDGASYSAEIIGSDPESDLAVIKVELPANQLTPIPLGDSSQAFVGQRAIAIGNPFGQEWTLTTGVISAIGRTLLSGTSQFSIPEMIQTDAAINPGNSGGPLLNGMGEVIGVNAVILSNSMTSSGVGFAIPINTVKRVVPELIEHGVYEYAWLGIKGRDLERQTAEAMELDPDLRGALVIEVVSGGPADKAGLRGSAERIERYGGEISIGGDVITAVNGQPVLEMDDLITYLVAETSPGDSIELSIVREGKEIEVEVELGNRSDSHAG